MLNVSLNLLSCYHIRKESSEGVPLQPGLYEEATAHAWGLVRERRSPARNVLLNVLRGTSRKAVTVEFLITFPLTGERPPSLLWGLGSKL